MPERHFFFGVLGTLKKSYLEQIIKEAHENRFKLGEKDDSKAGILITEEWLKELNKYPFHSSKCLQLICVEKPGTGIFLMRERAKLVKSQKDRKKFTLSKRLGSDEIEDDEQMADGIQNRKRKKVADGPPMSGSQQMMQSKPNNA